MKTNDREGLIRLFTMEKPYHLKYARLKKSHQDDKWELQKMVKEGLVEVIEKDRRWITYRYIGPVKDTI
jgi:hypothetical protein